MVDWLVWLASDRPTSEAMPVETDADFLLSLVEGSAAASEEVVPDIALSCDKARQCVLRLVWRWRSESECGTGFGILGQKHSAFAVVSDACGEGAAAVVQDYTEDPRLSITIVGTYLWAQNLMAQNTAEQASSTQHSRSVELTAKSPNPYTICIGDTTDPEPAATAAQAKAAVTPGVVAQTAVQVAETFHIPDPALQLWASGSRWDMCARRITAMLCAL